MSNNFNSQNIQQKGLLIPAYTGREIKRTIEKLCAPVFDFFKKDVRENPEFVSYEDCENQLAMEEKKINMFKDIMADADPTSRARIDFTM